MPGEIPAHCRSTDKVQEQRFGAGGAGVAIDRHKKPGSGAGLVTLVDLELEILVALFFLEAIL